jgi:hypothetical protein
MKNPNENICFVMMPFGNEHDKRYDFIYKPAIESLEFNSKRADNLYRPSPIIKDIWEYINKSKILLADITGLNPNVMYELGLAHAIAKPVIIISDTIESVPFDLRYLRILIYDLKNPNWAEELKNSISNSIQEIIASPTDSILSAFLKLRPRVEETDQISVELIEIKQLILSQLHNFNPIENKPQKRPLTETYAEALADSNRLYFDEGWDISNIKDFLTGKYGFSRQTADDVFHHITY